MANQALNQVPEVQDSELANVDYFLSVMKNGDIKKMSKEDMATVVGGLLNIQSYWKNESSDPPEGDCNKAIVAGAYVTSTNSINTPSEMSNIGYLLTFGENKAYRRLLQIYFNPEATKVGIRMEGLGASPITEITVQWRYINIVS